MPNLIATPCLRHLASAAETGLFLAAPAMLASAQNNQAPALIQIFPKGPNLSTVDGRTFKLSDPAGFAESFNAAAQPVVVDYDHLSAFNPEDGGSSKAAGWIHRLEVKDGEVWARVEWTDTAAAAIVAREYRFVSPEFYTHKTTGEVTQLRAAGLVNRPAFQMAALARAQETSGDKKMLKAIARALGLADDATDAQILAAIAKKESDHATELASARAPNLATFVPRADYDTVLARAETAERTLRETAEAARKAEVETVIATAVKAGKIAPASKEHYLALAASETGLEQVKALVSTLPPVIENPTLPEPSQAGGLTSEQRALCRSLGVSEDAFKAELARKQTA